MNYAKSTNIKKISFVIFFIFLISIPLIYNFFHDHEIIRHYTFENEALHSTIEAFGSLIAILMSMFLLIRTDKKSYSYFMAFGLLSMGTLDGFHAVCNPGKSFIFLHSMAGLVGGFLFSLAWVPSFNLNKKQLKFIFFSTFLVSITFSFVMITYTILIPDMTTNENFSKLAININTLSGIFFAISSIFFIHNFFKENKFSIDENFIFSCLTILFAIAGFTFSNGKLWDDDWWTWHLFRLSAYSLALCSIIYQFRTTIDTLAKTKESAIIHSKYLKNILESVSSPLYVIDTKTHKIKIANSAAKQLGLKKDGICYKATHERDTPCDGHDHPCPINIVKETKQSYTCEHIHKDADGKLQYIQINTYPILDSNNNVKEIIENTFNITQRKMDELKIIKQKIELERSNKELEQFAYVASHDLQEPLRMVSSYTQLIEKRYQDKLDQDANEFIHFAVDGAKRMQILISDLLQLSRVGTHGKPFENFDLNEAIEAAMKNLENLLLEKNAVIEKDNFPIICGDKHQFIQLFQNLIGNAIKFCDKTPNINLSYEETTNKHIFYVQDNGIGIESEYKEKIFIIFQRLHTKDKYPGTGIGLSICKKIVERHGGRITFESKINEGTTFIISLPKIGEQINDN